MARLKKFKFDLIDDLGPWCCAKNVIYKREVWNECWWEEGRGSHRRWERGIHRSVPDLVLVALLHMCG